MSTGTNGAVGLPAWARRNVDAALTLGTLLVLVLVLTVGHPRFLTGENIISVFYQLMFLLVVSVGMTIVVVGGGLDLSVGSLAALASSVSAVVVLKAGVVAGLLAGLATGMLAGLINGLVVTRLSVSPFIATLAMMVGARGLAYTLTDATSVSLPESVAQLGRGSLLGVPYLLVVTLLVFLAGYFLLHQTPFGLHAFAVGGHGDAARLVGIPVRRVVVWAYVLSGLTAGIAGLMLTTRFNRGLPTAGELMELHSLAAVVLGGTRLTGGKGGLWRTLAGVLLIAFLQNGLNLFGIKYQWQQVIIGAVFILAAVISTPSPRRTTLAGQS